MISEDESTPSEEPTLKDIDKRVSSIEDHLKQQDKQAKHETVFAIGAFGASVGLIGITLRVTTPMPSLANLAMSTLLIVWGFGIVIWAWCRFRKIRN